MDLESQDPIFNANLGQVENLIWTKKLRCSHSINTSLIHILTNKHRIVFEEELIDKCHLN